MAVLYDGGILINYFMECMVAQTQKNLEIMTIYFQNKKKQRFYITFGLKSEIHSQICLVSWGTEYFDENGDVKFASMNYLLTHPKYWKCFK